VLVAVGVLVLLIVVAACFYEMGRHDYRRELEQAWRRARCRECGASPEPRIRHVTGCEAGWPDPGQMFDGGR
jgi:hypothetical protein